MSRTTSVLLLTVLFCGAGTHVVQASKSGWDSVGIRAGVDLTDSHASGKGDFRKYELFANYLLPWNWRAPSSCELRTRVDVGAGMLARHGELGFIGSLGPSLALELFSGRVELDGGVAASGLSKHDFPGRDLGGPFLFNLHAGLGTFISRDIGLGYHYEHLSNADLYNRNPGLNLHMVELKFRF
jgi:hypothetical protein